LSHDASRSKGKERKYLEPLKVPAERSEINLKLDITQPKNKLLFSQTACNAERAIVRAREVGLQVSPFVA